MKICQMLIIYNFHRMREKVNRFCIIDIIIYMILQRSSPLFRKYNKLVHVISSITIITLFLMQQPYSLFRSQLQRLFVYYCSFGDKENTTLLKLQSYRRLLTDLQLLTPNKSDPYLPGKCDVIYYGKASPAGLTLHVFPKLLQIIAELFLPGEDGFERMMRRHIQPLHDYIMAETDFGRALCIIRPQLFREECYALLEQYELTLTSIYSHYWTQSGKEGQGEQLRTLMKMSKELNFVPKVIMKPVAQIVFGSLVQRNSTIAFRLTVKESSRFIFDLGCFMDYLIILSHLASREGNQSDQTKLYRLLQAMQVSPGYQKISKLTKLQHFFVPLQETLLKIAQSRITTTQNGSPLRASNKVRVKLIQTPIRKQLGEYYDPLKSKFVQLCTKKQVQSNFYLSESTALKMLGQICPKLPESTFQGLLATAGRLSFQKFVMLFDLAAEKVRIQRERLYDQVVKYTDGTGLMLVLENMQLDEQDITHCKEVLSLVRSYLRGIYDFYHFGKGLSLTALLKLLHETKLVPSVLTQTQSSTLFAAIVKQGNAVISFEQFQQFLLKMTVCVRFEGELQGVQRLLHIMQVVCGSKRGENLMKKNIFSVREHPLYKLRLIFAESYSKMTQKLQQQQF